jgi:putative flippase GtrA
MVGVKGSRDEPDRPDSSTAPRSVLLTWVTSHPAPRFVVVGGLTLVVDISALKVGHDFLGLSLPLATASAFALAFVVNFGLSRQWAFASAEETLVRRQLVRFVLLVAANLASTLLIVVGLVHLSVYYLSAKLIAVAVNSVANFVLYRRWVFV